MSEPQQTDFLGSPTIHRKKDRGPRQKKDKKLVVLGHDDCPLNFRMDYRVEGSGNPESDIWIVGEAPGRNEAFKKIPFVGESGDLLWEVLKEYGKTRNDFCIRNTVQCWPPGNRTPTTLEVKHCKGYLETELRQYKPKVVITLGGTALQALMGKKYKITECHGQELIREDGLKIVPLFHPSFLIRLGKDPDMLNLWRVGLSRAFNSAKGVGKTSILEAAGYKLLVLGAERFREYLKFVWNRWAAWDLETHGKTGAPFLISSAWGTKVGIVSDWDKVKHLLPHYVDSPTPLKVFQNGCGFDIHVLERELDVRLRGYEWDTFVAGVTLDSRKGKNNLTRLSEWACPDLAGYDGEMERYVKANAIKDYADVPREIILPYSGGDAIATAKVYMKQKPMAYRPLVKFYMELVRDVLWPMEQRGIRTDVAMLDKMIEHYSKANIKLEAKLKAIAGEPDFKAGSHDQVAWLLFEHLGLSSEGVKTSRKTGMLSVDKETLTKLAGQHPAVDLLSELRSNEKSLKTYAIRIKRELKGDRFCVRYWIGGADKEDAKRGAETGRLSSPLQNIPRVNKDKPRAYEPADIFIPDPGYVFLVPDYSQIELRVAALLSGDERMIEDFQKGYDAHTATCWNYLGVPRGTQPPKEIRVKAKAINFAKIFGATANGLSRQLKCSVDEALKMLLLDQKKYPGYWEWRRKQVARTWKLRYIETLFGYKRPIEIFDERFQYDALSLSHWQKQALNTPVQGTASQLLLLGMVAIKRMRIPNGEMLLNIHDSAPMQVKEGKEQEVGKRVKWAFEKGVVKLVKQWFGKDISIIPWTVEIECGPRLSKLQSLEV